MNATNSSADTSSNPPQSRFITPRRKDYTALEFTSWWRVDSAYTSVIRAIWLREDKYSQNKILKKDKSKKVTADTSSLEQAVSGFIGFLQEAPNNVTASPRTENDAPISDIVESDLKDQYNEHEPSIAGQKTLYDLVLRGMPFMRVERDAELWDFDNPNGKVTVTPIDPFDVYLDSRATWRKDVRRITVLNWMQRKDARERWTLPDGTIDPIFNNAPICGTIKSFGKSFGEATDDYDIIPVACVYFLETQRELTLLPDTQDVQVLAQSGIQAQPGVAMKCPDGYQTQAHGKVGMQKVQVWYYAYHYNEKILEEPQETYTYNCAIKFTDAITFKMNESEGSFGPYSVGIIYKVMDLQLLKSIMDTIFAQMAVSNLGVWVSILSNKLTKDSADKLNSAIKSKDAIKVLNIDLQASSPGEKLTLKDVLSFNFPQQVSTAPIEGAKYIAEQILGQIGMRDQTTGGGPASDPYIKFEQRIQQSMLQMKPIVQAYEDFIQEIMQEIYENRRRMLDYQTTIRTMAIDQAEFMTINRVIPIAEFQQDVLMGIYPADIPRVVDQQRKVVIVNPFGGNHEIRVEVSALSKTEQMQEYQEALNDVVAGTVSRRRALSLHPRWGKAPARILKEGVADYIERTQMQMQMQPPAPPPIKVSLTGQTTPSQTQAILADAGIKAPKPTAREISAQLGSQNGSKPKAVKKAA